MQCRENVPLLVDSPQSKSTFIFQGRLVNYVSSTKQKHEAQNLEIPTSQKSCRLYIFVGIFIGIVVVLLAGVLSFRQNLQSLLQQSSSEHKITPNTDFHDITIPQGILRGFTRKSRQGRDFISYFKVPYAEPPIGKLRFLDPIAPNKRWNGIRSEQELAPQCIQRENTLDGVQAVGQEDCLYANIYVPNVVDTQDVSGQLLPVMVNFFGGGFIEGDGSRFGPEYFMDEDVLIITFQYRLGPFGFLSTEDDVIRGNMGFKDQVQMLRWTQDNIQYFGGNPQKVTILGQSAGGMSVGFMMLSPMAKGLFHRAISQSGTDICASYKTYPNVTVAEMGSVLGCDIKNSTAFLECLRRKDAKEIALVKTPKIFYGLTVESLKDDRVFMPENPYYLARDKPNQVPYMIGVVNGEWTAQALAILKDDQLVKSLNDNWETVARRILMFGPQFSKEDMSSVKDFYFGNKPVANETLRNLISLVSDRGMVQCSYLSAKLHDKHSPTYLYYLTKPPAKSSVEKSNPEFSMKENGLLAHTDELQYFWKYPDYPEIKAEDKEDFGFSQFLIKTWVNFAKHGKPQNEWLRVFEQGTNADAFWYELNDNPGKTDDAVQENMKFWDGFTHQQLGHGV